MKTTTPPWLYIAIMSVIVTALLLIIATRPGGHLPADRIPSTGTSYGIYEDPCAGKERCLCFYIAPWCPACHSALPFFQALNTSLLNEPRVGFKLIIGRDSEDEIRALAFRIPLNVFMDINRTFSQAFGNAVPSWILANREREILRRGAGAPAGSDIATIRYFLSERVRIGEYLSEGVRYNE